MQLNLLYEALCWQFVSLGFPIVYLFCLGGYLPRNDSLEERGKGRSVTLERSSQITE